MTPLSWDNLGARFFESGLDRGVLYLEDGSGVAWNGLISVEDRPNDTSIPVYQDGVKYLDAEGLGDFTAALKAFTYPDAFEQFEGVGDMGNGLTVYDQPTKRFGLSYRTKIGDDVEGTDHGYEIHILYNLTARVEAATYASLGNQVVPMTFSWILLGVPMVVEGFRPTAHFIIDSRELPADALADLEALLYGTSETEPQIPTVDQLIVIGEPIYITDNGDGTWSATGPDELIMMLDENTFQIEGANATYSDPGTYEISNS